MAKKVGYEVTALKAVCVDFPDGRVVSFQPGTRFTAHPTNTSVRRLARSNEIRKLGPYEAVPPLPVKLGAPHKVQNVLLARKQVEQARKAAEAKAKRLAAQPQQPTNVNLGALHQPRTLSDPDTLGDN